MMKMPIKVVADPENPVAVEVIEKAIVAISEGMRRINQTRLNRRALIALIHDNSKVAKSTIEVVLNNLEGLESLYLKKKEK